MYMQRRPKSQITNLIREKIKSYEGEFFTINDIRRDCSISYYTAREHLHFLQELGIIDGMGHTFYEK